VENNSKSIPEFIPHSRPTLGPEEIAAVSEVIASGHIAEGPVTAEFEQRFADYLNIGHAVSTASGTAALHLALLAMGAGPGDEVIIPSYVCSALLNAVNYVGAVPVLAEIDRSTFNLDADDVKTRLSRRTKAVVVPHLFGMPADMDGLRALDVPIIEDCAQALGSSYQGKPLGTLGDAAVFSFYATKVIATGEGGMVVSNSGDLTDRVRDLKAYDNKEDYEIRYNYKMSDMQAAMGLVQLNRLDTIAPRRRAIAGRYFEAFQTLDLQQPPQDAGHIYYRYVLGLKTDCAPWLKLLSGKGVECGRPIHRPLHHYLKQPGFPVTEAAWEQNLSIPIYPSLTEEEMIRVIDAIVNAGD